MNYKGSLSGLVRYAKRNHDTIQGQIDEKNQQLGTNVTFGQVANTKNIVQSATHAELYNEDGSEKRVFSSKILSRTITRLAKRELEEKKLVSDKHLFPSSVWPVRK